MTHDLNERKPVHVAVTSWCVCSRHIGTHNIKYRPTLTGFWDAFSVSLLGTLYYVKDSIVIWSMAKLTMLCLGLKQGHHRNGDQAARQPHMMCSICGRRFATAPFGVCSICRRFPGIPMSHCAPPQFHPPFGSLGWTYVVEKVPI